MCGIAGILNFDGKVVRPEQLSAMTNRMIERGPDDEGFYRSGSVGLGFRRLSIIDLATGHQPLQNEDEALQLVFNGEIYNHIELRDQLVRRGHIFRTQSDSEVLLHLYEEKGIAALDDLNGMFAFALYDKRKNALLIARDRLGIKPLFYATSPQKFVFASDIRALRTQISTKIDSAAVLKYLALAYVPATGTMLNGVKKLLPGHYILVTADGNIAIEKYWALGPPHMWRGSLAEARTELDMHLDDAIRLQMRSDVPVGIFLSGGLDSSALVAYASKFSREPLRTYTVNFAGKDSEDVQYAHLVAGRYGTNHFDIQFEFSDVAAAIDDLLPRMDEPISDSAIFPAYLLSKAARQHGVKVLLNGAGGDEIFGGYARYLVAYLEQAIKGSIFESNEEEEHIVSLRSILPNLPSLKQYLPMIKNFWKDDAFEPMDRRYYNLINRMGTTTGFLQPEFLNERNENEIFSKFSRQFNNPDTKSYYNKMTQFDLTGSLPALLQVEDRVSMAVSIESRVPLLDRRIIDLISRMPAGMKFKGGELKYLMKRTVKDIMPPEILNRKDKMGFPVPLHIWSKNHARDFIMDTLLSKNAKERNILNTKHIEKLINSEQPFSRGLWGLLSLEIWFNQFIDK